MRTISSLISTILRELFDSRDSFDKRTFNESKREIKRILIFVNLFVIFTIWLSVLSNIETLSFTSSIIFSNVVNVICE